MNAIFRTLLTWLVLLALPLQGYAAAAALPCAAAGGDRHTAAAPENASMAAMHHDHHAMLMAAAMQHGEQASLAAAGDQPHATPPAGHDGQHGAAHDASHAKCGSCPACWAGPAMLPPSFAPVGVQPQAIAAIAFDPGHFPSFHPSLPERPPRLPLV